MIDWNEALSTFIGALAGAGVAAAVTIWLTRNERPIPLWSFYIRPGLRTADDPGFAIGTVEITNVGNGVAHKVSFDFENAARWGATSAVALVMPGQAFEADFCVAIRGDVDILNTIDTRTPDWPEPGVLTLTWHQPPRLEKQKHESFALGLNRGGSRVHNLE